MSETNPTTKKTTKAPAKTAAAKTAANKATETKAAVKKTAAKVADQVAETVETTAAAVEQKAAEVEKKVAAAEEKVVEVAADTEEKVEKQLKGRNWARLWSSLLVLCIGLILCCWPGLAAGTLVTFVGIAILVAGALRIYNYCSDSILSTGWDLAIGILDVLAGIALIMQPILFSNIMVGALIAYYAMLSGITHCYYAIVERKVYKYWWVALILSLLVIALGVCMAFVPAAVALIAGWTVGITLVLLGLSGVFNFIRHK